MELTPEVIAAARPLDEAFVADCPYAPEAMLLDGIVGIDEAASTVWVRWPTSDALPLTRDQRVHPLKHPRHVSGGLMVHMTGMAGFVHAYYLLGLRHHEGWTGYGGRIHDAKYRTLAPPGAPIVIECRGSRIVRRTRRILARYALRFWQSGNLVYEGDQTAMWLKIDEHGGLPVEADAD